MICAGARKVETVRLGAPTKKNSGGLSTRGGLLGREQATRHAGGRRGVGCAKIETEQNRSVSNNHAEAVD